MQLVERVRNYLQLSENSYIVDIVNSIVIMLDDYPYMIKLSTLYLWTKKFSSEK